MARPLHVEMARHDIKCMAYTPSQRGMRRRTTRMRSQGICSAFPLEVAHTLQIQWFHLLSSSRAGLCPLPAQEEGGGGCETNAFVLHSRSKSRMHYKYKGFTSSPPNARRSRPRSCPVSTFDERGVHARGRSRPKRTRGTRCIYVRRARRSHPRAFAPDGGMGYALYLRCRARRT